MSHDLVRQTTTTMTSPFTLASAAGFDTFAARYAVGASIFVGLQGLDASGAPVAQRCVGVGQLLGDGRLQIDSVSAGSNGAALPAFSCDSIVVVDVMSVAALEALATMRANAVVDSRILTRGPGDMWIQLTCSGTPTTAGQEVSVQALGSGSSGPEASPLPGDTTGFGCWSMRSNASSNNSGYSYRSTAAAEAVPARGGLFARTRAAIRTTSSSMRSILAAFFNGAATSGFGWIFFGDQAQARVGNGSVAQTTPFTLAVDTFYVFETEVAADFLSATFRIYDGNTEALLFSETIASNFPAVGLGLTIFFAQGIFVTTPGAITNTVSVSHMGAGTRRGYDVWRRGIA